MADIMDAKRAYAKYRIEKAKDDLVAAKIMYKDEHYRVANNRAYYCVGRTNPDIG